MKPVDFTLHRPETLAEAVTILAEHPDDSKVLAGGQSLVPLLNFRLARPEHVVDLSRISSLAMLRRTADELVIGAMVRQAQAEASPAVAEYAPLLRAALPNIAHPPIRNRGTIGGSIAHADPAAELPSVARALDATLVALGPQGRREIAAADFFLANLTTTLASDEILVEIRFAKASPRTGAAFEEVSRRQGDFAIVGAGAQLSVADDRTVADARICLTGVDRTPYRAVAAEQLLIGHALSDELLAEAAESTRRNLEPSGDLHASAAYRRDVAGEVLARSVAAAHHRATVSTAA